MFRNQDARAEIRPLTRHEVTEDLLPAVRRSLGDVIDRQEEFSDLSMGDEEPMLCSIRLRIHPEAWPLIAPMRDLLTAKLQRSVDLHTRYRELSVRFNLSISKAATSTGGTFSIEVGDDFAPAPHRADEGPTYAAQPDLQGPSKAQSGAFHTAPMGGPSSYSAPSSFDTRVLDESGATMATLVADDGFALEAVEPSGRRVLAILTDKWITVGRCVEPGSAKKRADVEIEADEMTSCIQLMMRIARDDRQMVEIVNVGRNSVTLAGSRVAGQPRPVGNAEAIQAAVRVPVGAELQLGHMQKRLLRIGTNSGTVSQIPSGRQFKTTELS